MMGDDNNKKRDNPTPKNNCAVAEINAQCKAVGQSLILRPDLKWESHLNEMNEGKRGRLFVYSDFLMGSIAYIRMVAGLSLSIMYEEVGGMFLLMGRSPTSSHVTI